MEINVEDIKLLLEAFPSPYHYEEGEIRDKEQSIIINIRGWSYLRNKYGGELCLKIQDTLGRLVVETLNETLKDYQDEIYNL